MRTSQAYHVQNPFWPYRGAGWFVPHADGTFEPCEHDRTDALRGRYLPIDVPYRGKGLLADVVAWEDEEPRVWWRWSRDVNWLGADVLQRAVDANEPVGIVRTPLEYLELYCGVLCVLDWSIDLRFILARAPEVIVYYPDLYERLVRHLRGYRRVKLTRGW